MRKREVALDIYMNTKMKCKMIRRTDYADKDITATIATEHLFFS
jgi:hypothetical protein